jgi:hypothetical protein
LRALGYSGVEETMEASRVAIAWDLR